VERIDLTHFRSRLLGERMRVERQIRSIKESGLDWSARDSIKELSFADNHPADVASETFERGKDLGLKIDAKFMLDKIDEALAAMDEGAYGQCARCGRAIGPERLEAVPWTLYCRECRQRLDDGLHASRPVEEQVIRMPFGNYDLVRDYAGYDGQDSWQDAARGGASMTPQDSPGARDYEDMVDEDEPGPGQRVRNDPR
jgi:YteA family regulatory protein